MEWEIYFATSIRGERWVQTFIDQLKLPLQARVIRYLSLLKIKGPYIGLPLTKKIQLNLFELRIIGQNNIRILYTISDHKIILLHAFSKKSRKLKQKDINIALRRMLTKIT